ncbi:hypothetical protein [Streptomyces sp. CT34]|uniref:hypothetical protein n=1 Tax=Streptomyces sp. CT34 TaxID=1553907 RepID=UPI0018E2E854|nr:hypothetical protein [Streptomyces sp. CT34]
MYSKTIAATLLAGTAVLGTAGAAAAESPGGRATEPVTGALANLPVESVMKALPAGGPESLAAGRNALRSGLATAPVTVDTTLGAMAAGGEG